MSDHNRLYVCDKCQFQWVSLENECPECGHLQVLEQVLSNKEAEERILGQTISEISIDRYMHFDGCFTSIKFDSGDVAIMDGHVDHAIISGIVTKEGYYLSVEED